MRLKKLEVMDQQEIRKIHAASLEILENCGVTVHSAEALELLSRGGAIVDRENKRARLPKALVEKCLSSIPKTFDMYDRSGNFAFTVGDETPHCAAGHNAIFCIDPKTLERRYATVKDVEDFAVVAQQMQTIDMVGVPLNPMDVPKKSTLLHAARALFECGTKPLFFSTESAGIVASLIDMMRAAAGTEDIASKPNAIIQLSPTSPLYWEEGAAEGVILTAKAGVPLAILPEPMSGVSAPYSTAGLLTEHNTELLSGVVLAQLANPGAPLVYASSWTTYDMRSSYAMIGSPESTILRIAGCQMARFYNMPSHTTAPNTDSNAYDEYNAWESVLSNAAGLLADNDIVMNSGMFASGLTASVEQLVMDNEVNGILLRMRRGIQVDDEMIAADVIQEVGPSNNFLMEDHTLEHLRTGEFYHTTIPVNYQYESWMAQGAPTVDVLAGEIAKKILAKGNPVYPGDELMDKLGRIIAEFEAKYC